MRIFALATFAALAFGGSANAVVVNTTTCTPLNVATCSVPGAVVSAGGPSSPVLKLVDFRGNSAIGVGPVVDTGDSRDLEIQGGEADSLTIDYAVAQFVNTVILGVFYNPDEFGNDPEEVALITAYGAFGSSQIEIKNVGNNMGDVTGTPIVNFGTITRSGPNDIADGRVTITDLFPGLAVTQLVFTALDTPTNGGDNSDYAVELVSTSQVPLPLTAFLLPTGLVLLRSIKRRT